MTPQEKANKLVEKFYQTTPNEAWINQPIGLAKEYKAYNQAKECALIAVDEILELTKKPTYNPFNWNEITGSYYDKYWLEVKQEIETL